MVKHIVKYVWRYMIMKPIEVEEVENLLLNYKNKDIYVHLETTNGAYASHFGNQGVNVGAYIRNAKVKFIESDIKGEQGAFRVGLKLETGWVYAEGLTDFEYTDEDQLLLAGHDTDGRLTVALQLSENPFK